MFFKKIIYLIIIFFLVSLSTLYFSLKQKIERVPEIEINISGPKEIKTFEIANYRLNIINKSKLILKNVNLKIFLPQNATFISPKKEKHLSFYLDLEPEVLKFYDFSLVFSYGEGIFPLKILAKNNEAEFEYIHEINLRGEGIETNIEIPKRVEKEVDFPIKVTLQNNLNSDQEIYFKITPLFGFVILKDENEFNEYEEKLFIKKGERIIRHFFGNFKKETNYGVKNLNFEFYLIKDKEISYGKNINLALELEESKVLIDLNVPKFISSETNLNLTLNLKNNSNKILKKPKIKIELDPDYFEISSIKVSNNGYAKFEETLNIYWDYEKNPELLNFNPNRNISLSFNLKTKIRKDYFNLQIPFRVIFKDELENINYEKIFITKVKGELAIERKISFIEGSPKLKAQQTSKFLVTINLKPFGEEISKFALYFKTPYWTKIKNASEGEFSENSFYLKKEKLSNEEKIEIFLEVTPYINQVGENILIIEKTDISFYQNFSEIEANLSLPEISSKENIENFIPGPVSF
mgnify:CR=1 FL=1